MKNFFRKETFGPNWQRIDRVWLIGWILLCLFSLLYVLFAPVLAHAEDLSPGDRTRVQVAAGGYDAALDRLPPQVQAQAVKLQADIDEIRAAAAQLILRVCPSVALQEGLSFAEELQACNREIDASRAAGNVSERGGENVTIGRSNSEGR